MYASSLRHKILILCCSYNDIEAVIQAIKLWVSNWYILHPIDPKKDLPEMCIRDRNEHSGTICNNTFLHI